MVGRSYHGNTTNHKYEASLQLAGAKNIHGNGMSACTDVLNACDPVRRLNHTFQAHVRVVILKIDGSQPEERPSMSINILPRTHGHRQTPARGACRLLIKRNAR